MTVGGVGGAGVALYRRVLFSLGIERPKDDSRLKWGGTPQKWS